MPSKSRRDFLQVSATAASALAIGAVVSEVETRSAPLRDQVARDPKVRAFESTLIKARPVPLANVRLTGGPLKNAQDLTAVYLLSLDPDRMMAFYRTRAGLEPKGQPYGGWDGPGHNLTGHIAGHHLSAVSLMYLATGDARFKDRGDILVREMKDVQDKNGDGLVSGLELIRDAFGALSKGDIRPAAFDLNGVWSPWYTLHKTFAGLRDAYRHLGNRIALDVESKFAGWAERVLAPLDDAQIQRMLLTEHGGMEEVLSDLYADTGDRRWLNLSYKFEHRAFTDALKRHQDNLNGKHGNCQIPKLIGSAARYGYIGDPQDIMAASFFWDRVAQHHSYATGGHGLAEYFGPPDKLSLRVDGRAAESCNVYNMLKLTRRLFSYRPDAFYSDFHERALFNHVLGSIDNEDGRTSYMVPVGRGVMQEYQDMQRSFTCCVGSGMESHALHGDGIYYESDDTVWVTLFAPSTANLPMAGSTLTMDTGFPDGDNATITFNSMKAPREFTLAVRRPSWAGDEFSIAVNGAAVAVPKLASLRAGGAGGRNLVENGLPPSSFVEIKRAWKAGDVVTLSLPKTIRLEPTPDDPHVAAIMWGPLVLAGDWGPRRDAGRGRGNANAGATANANVAANAGATANAAANPNGNIMPAAPAPVAPAPVATLVAADKPIAEWVRRDPANPANFRTTMIGRVASEPAKPTDVLLTPFYRTHKRTYSVYFDVMTPAEWSARLAAAESDAARTKRINDASLAFVQPGDTAKEPDFNYQSDPPNRMPQRGNGNARSSRSGQGWFLYEMPVNASGATSLIVTYQYLQEPPPGPADFQILIDGTPIAHFEPDTKANGYYDVEYTIPPALSSGKQKVTVKFQAASADARIAAIFGVRTIRA